MLVWRVGWCFLATFFLYFSCPFKALLAQIELLPAMEMGQTITKLILKLFNIIGSNGVVKDIYPERMLSLFTCSSTLMFYWRACKETCKNIV